MRSAVVRPRRVLWRRFTAGRRVAQSSGHAAQRRGSRFRFPQGGSRLRTPHRVLPGGPQRSQRLGRAVQEHLRHADIQTTTVYTRLTQSDLQKVISEFDKNNGDGNRDSRPVPHGT